MVSCISLECRAANPKPISFPNPPSPPQVFLDRNCDHTPPVLFLSEEDAAIPEPEREAAIRDNLEA
jgi:hypothetical protein